MPEEVPHFIPPEIQNNSFGWGPCEMPDQFREMPYQPFSKGDRIGKVSLSLQFLFYPYANIKIFSRYPTGPVYRKTRNI